LKFGSSFTQNIGKGNEIDAKHIILVNPNEVILEEIISAGEAGETTIQ